MVGKAHRVRDRLGWSMALVILTFGLPSGTLGHAPADPAAGGAERAMDFLSERFPLRDLPYAKLPYLDYLSPHLPLDWRPVDADGIKLRLWNGRLYYHPVELGLLTLRLLSGYRRTHNPEYLRWAERYAAKIRQISIESDGALFVPYRFYYATEGLRPPWFSGMSQGIILSAFVRLHRLTHKAWYLRNAEKLFASFQRSGPSSRPWVSRVSPYHYLWIEEYPRNDRDDRVLNGFMFAVFGLYEYWQHTRRTPARQLLEGTLHTLKTQVHHYRVPGGISYYCLYHRTQYAKYHLVHLMQLQFLAAMSGDAFFARTADLWRSDYPGRTPSLEVALAP